MRQLQIFYSSHFLNLVFIIIHHTVADAGCVPAGQQGGSGGKKADGEADAAGQSVPDSSHLVDGSRQQEWVLATTKQGRRRAGGR